VDHTMVLILILFKITFLIILRRTFEYFNPIYIQKYIFEYFNPIYIQKYIYEHTNKKNEKINY
jgi:hypothetical protein